MENVSQIYGFLIKDCIDIHKDVIDFCSDIGFDVISWLLEDGTVLGFVNVPLIYWELAKSGSNHQWEATTPNQSGFLVHLSMVRGIQHLGVKVLLRFIKLVAQRASKC